MLARPVLFSGRNTSKILRVDPTGLTLPVLTVGKVYGVNAAGNMELGNATTSILVLGFYLGTDTGGLLQFEQERVESVAAFTGRGTTWYLSTLGNISVVASAIQIGIAISADALLITADRVLGGGAITGIDLVDALGTIASNVQIVDVDTDAPGNLPFGKVTESPAGTAQLAIDKQTTVVLVQELTPEPTGFAFDITVYRAVEVFYLLSVEGDIYETGSIYMLHNGSVAGVRVDLHDLTPQGEPASGVTFSADVSGGNCRLLYTKPAAGEATLAIKPRAIIGTAPLGEEA